MQIAPRPRAYENTIGRPTWSPDGKLVASEKGRDVVVINREDNTVQAKLGPEGAWVHTPDWSPDGDRVSYSVFGKHRDYDTHSWAVYSSKPDGSDAKIMMSEGQEPEYNPQGELVAYNLTKPHTEDRIMIVKPDGSDAKAVSRGGHLFQDHSWSPGGHQIAYDGKFDGMYQIRVTDITGTKDRMLTNGEELRFTDKNPEWAPEGNTIMFERHFRRALANSVMTIDSVTGEEKVLLQGTCRNLDPVWSPDGSKVAFVSDRDNETYDLDLYVMDADGKNVTQVSDYQGQEYAPAWSPDGKALAFNRWDREAEGDDRDAVHIVELPKELWGGEPS